VNHCDSLGAARPRPQQAHPNVPQLEKALDIDCLMKWIDGMSPKNPADRAEFDALVGIFRENNGKIKTLYAEQMETIEELIALSHDAPQGA
jgi:hypothetical protein